MAVLLYRAIIFLGKPPDVVASMPIMLAQVMNRFWTKRTVKNSRQYVLVPNWKLV